MLYNKIKMAIYALFINNLYGFKLKNANSHSKKKKLRIKYSLQLLEKLNIKVKVKNRENLPKNGQFLLISNHRSIIDPLIVEIALKETDIFGLWISKKELASSPFFGSFIRNGGAILLNKKSKSMSDSFKEIKTFVNNGDSIFVFPEGTRNKENTRLLSFKGGTKLIALKNRLPILPVYIRTDANVALQSALKSSKMIEIEIDIGALIDCKSKLNLEETYRDRFGI